MSLKQLREAHNVPAYRGAKVIYTDCSDVEHIGHITSSNGSHININFGKGSPRKHHPTWHIEYVDEALGDDK